MQGQQRTIIIVVVVLLLCCCCLIAAVGAYWLWQNGDQLMGAGQTHGLLPMLSAVGLV
jgi:hypothetical protein